MNSLEKYSWPGNIRQLKNVSEQISVIEKSRDVSDIILRKYLPDIDSSRNLPMVIDGKKEHESISERDILYKVLFEMKQDVTEMKRVIVDLLNNNNLSSNEKNELITKLKSSNTFDYESNFDNLIIILYHLKRNRESSQILLTIFLTKKV